MGNKPHVLVAYAWCFYMAVFSGGRWIRSELVKAGSDFWRPETGTTEKPAQDARLEDRGLSFWSFSGDYDGLDIKEAFKQRLLAAEGLFTLDERIDIIEEAKTIFTLSSSLVRELDEKLGTDFEKVKAPKAAELHQAEPVGDKASKVTVNMSHAVGTWIHRPEVTGVAVALGCLACVALLRMGY